MVVVVLCLAGVTAVSMQVRCIDAAREAARLAARGDTGSAETAARAVHHYFIQRELSGLRRHDDAIRDLAIPREVLVRLGAS